jgi:RNA polymerase sigma factor (TIGR02999 family)
MSDTTQILMRIESGDPSAPDQLLPLVYDELRKLAAARLAMERAGHTLQTTALVHEAYLRLVSGDHVQQWKNRRHFFAAAAEAMRRILIEHARRQATAKRGGHHRRLEFQQDMLWDDGRSAQLLALDEALAELAKYDAQAAELVKLRYFAGLTHSDAAEVMQIGRRTADRLWALAKAWLYQQLTSD